MRNPNRIPEILQKIEKIWKAHPDLRLGQFIGNVVNPMYLYEIEDELLVKMLQVGYGTVINVQAQINHKGEFCIHNKDVFCQEGICSDCEIHKVAIC